MWPWFVVSFKSVFRFGVRYVRSTVFLIDRILNNDCVFLLLPSTSYFTCMLPFKISKSGKKLMKSQECPNKNVPHWEEGWLSLTMTATNIKSRTDCAQFGISYIKLKISPMRKCYWYFEISHLFLNKYDFNNTRIHASLHVILIWSSAVHIHG